MMVPTAGKAHGRPAISDVPEDAGHEMQEYEELQHNHQSCEPVSSRAQKSVASLRQTGSLA